MKLKTGDHVMVEGGAMYTVTLVHKKAVYITPSGASDDELHDVEGPFFPSEYKEWAVV
jgi:hypothetical protein